LEEQLAHSGFVAVHYRHSLQRLLEAQLDWLLRLGRLLNPLFQRP
jgi:hypothetical protein